MHMFPLTKQIQSSLLHNNNIATKIKKQWKPTSHNPCQTRKKYCENKVKNQNDMQCSGHYFAE